MNVFPFLSEVCPSTWGLDPRLHIKNFTPLPISPFTSVSLSVSVGQQQHVQVLWWFPSWKQTSFDFIPSFSLLPGQHQLRWMHGLCLLNILPNSPPLLTTPCLSLQFQKMVPKSSMLLTTMLPTRRPFLSPRLRWHVTSATAGCFLLLNTLFSLDVHALLCPSFPPISQAPPFPYTFSFFTYHFCRMEYFWVWSRAAISLPSTPFRWLYPLPPGTPKVFLFGPTTSFELRILTSNFLLHIPFKMTTPFCPRSTLVISIPVSQFINLHFLDHLCFLPQS